MSDTYKAERYNYLMFKEQSKSVIRILEESIESLKSLGQDEFSNDLEQRYYIIKSLLEECQEDMRHIELLEFIDFCEKRQSVDKEKIDELNGYLKEFD